MSYYAYPILCNNLRQPYYSGTACTSGKKGRDGGFGVNRMPYVCLRKHSLACYTKIQLPDHLKNLSSAVTSSDLSISIYLMFVSSGKGITKFGNFSRKQ